MSFLGSLGQHAHTIREPASCANEREYSVESLYLFSVAAPQDFYIVVISMLCLPCLDRSRQCFCCLLCSSAGRLSF